MPELRNQLEGHICCRMLMKWFYTLWSTCPSFFFTFVKMLEILKLGKTEKLREGSVNHKNSFILLIGMLNGILWPGKRRCLPVVLLEYLFGRSTLRFDCQLDGHFGSPRLLLLRKKRFFKGLWCSFQKL